MTVEQAMRPGRQSFGAEPFAPPAAPDFGGPRRFAESLAAGLLRTRAMVPPADRILAQEADSVSINPRIDLHLALVAGASTPDVLRERPTLEVLRERSHSEGVHVIERSRAPAAVEPPQRLFERLTQRFERVEREVRLAPAFLPRPDRPAKPAAPRPAAPTAASAAMVLHHRQLPAPSPQADVRRLPPSAAPTQPGNPAISPREISRVADEVIFVLNRQSLAWRERFGRG
jgi:hypothetical protein